LQGAGMSAIAMLSGTRGNRSQFLHEKGKINIGGTFGRATIAGQTGEEFTVSR